MKNQIKTYKTISYLKLICCIISKILLLLGGICIARNPKFVAGFKNSIFLLLASFIMHLIAVALESNSKFKKARKLVIKNEYNLTIAGNGIMLVAITIITVFVLGAFLLFWVINSLAFSILAIIAGMLVRNIYQIFNLNDTIKPRI